MNTKVIAALVAAALVLGGVFYYQKNKPAPVPVQNMRAEATSTPVTEGGKKSSEPTFSIGKAVPITPSVTFDPASLVSTSTYPTITGTTNLPGIGIVIRTADGVDVVGTADVSAPNGRWAYPCSVALAPGRYTVIAYKNTIIAAAALVVQ